VADGVAFVAEEELSPLAAELGLELPEFTRRFLRSVVDPRDLVPRFALRDRPDGACCLLDGDNQCTAYAARPQGCRDFPRWPSILGDERGLARAMRLCPGIEERPSGAAREAALDGLQQLLERAPRPTACAFPAAAGREPSLTGLELELLVEGLEAPLAATGCPLEEAGPNRTSCGDPARAPLACRRATPLPPDAVALAEERDAFEATLPWARRYGALTDLLRARRDPAAIELHPLP